MWDFNVEFISSSMLHKTDANSDRSCIARDYLSLRAILGSRKIRRSKTCKLGIRQKCNESLLDPPFLRALLQKNSRVSRFTLFFATFFRRRDSRNLKDREKGRTRSFYSACLCMHSRSLRKENKRNCIILFLSRGRVVRACKTFTTFITNGPVTSTHVGIAPLFCRARLFGG